MTTRARALAIAALVVAPACARRPDALELPRATRLVVVAPHPDDETLAAGGIVQRVLAGGGTVTIVVVTSGDGYLEAAAALSGHPAPSSLDYRWLGEVREREVREAARLLGVAPANVVLLGQPDGGLAALWTDHWSAAAPYVSPYTGRGPFSGVGLAGRLRDALEVARPTLVIAPDPRDVHDDHACTGRFVRLAVAGLRDRPTVLTYVVHDVEWPPLRPQDNRMPPPSDQLYDGTRWVSFDLTPAELATKREALALDRSQWPVLGGLLERFLRANEIFAVEGTGG